VIEYDHLNEKGADMAKINSKEVVTLYKATLTYTREDGQTMEEDISANPETADSETTKDPSVSLIQLCYLTPIEAAMALIAYAEDRGKIYGKVSIYEHPINQVVDDREIALSSDGGIRETQAMVYLGYSHKRRHSDPIATFQGEALDELRAKVAARKAKNKEKKS
jgi:hypothetical protein